MSDQLKTYLYQLRVVVDTDTPIRSSEVRRFITERLEGENIPVSRRGKSAVIDEVTFNDAAEQSYD